MEEYLEKARPSADGGGTPTAEEHAQWEMDLSQALGAFVEDGENEPETANSAPSGADGDTDPPAKETADGDKEVSFTLSHLGETRTVEREEVVALAQKGLDYDFVKDRLEQAREKLKDYERLAAESEEAATSYRYLQSCARKAEVTVEQYIRAMKISELTGAGMDENNARAKIELEEREERLLQSERRLNDLQRSKNGGVAAEAEDAKRRGDVAEFVRLFPGVRGEAVPQEVWEEVRRGAPLSAAYLKHENKKLRAELAAVRQDKDNREKTPGSVKTAGSRNENADPYLAALSADD